MPTSIRSSFFLRLAGASVARFRPIFSCRQSGTLLSWIFLLFGKMKHSVISSLIAVLRSLQTFQVFLIPMPMGESGGNHAELVHLLLGYYLRTASIVIVLAASWCRRGKSNLLTKPSEGLE
jgi:hypothetical protein